MCGGGDGGERDDLGRFERSVSPVPRRGAAVRDGRWTAARRREKKEREAERAGGGRARGGRRPRGTGPAPTREAHRRGRTEEGALMSCLALPNVRGSDVLTRPHSSSMRHRCVTDTSPNVPPMRHRYVTPMHQRCITDASSMHHHLEDEAAVHPVDAALLEREHVRVREGDARDRVRAVDESRREPLASCA
jgi:hypothetical protein